MLFLNTLTGKGGSNIVLVHCLMRLVTSQIEAYKKQRHLMPSLPLSLALMMGPGTPRALLWKSMTGG